MLLSGLLYLLATPAFAEDPEFAGTDDPSQEFDEPEADLSAEIGGAFASGNVQYLTVNGLVTGNYRWDRNKITGKLGANIGQAIQEIPAVACDPEDPELECNDEVDGVLSDNERAQGMTRNAQRIDSELRYDRYIGKEQSLYVLAGAFIDPFAGYTLRSHEQLGYSRILVDTDSTNLVAEIGADYAQEFYTDETLDPGNIFAARVLVGFQHQFNESVSFSEKVEVYENVITPADVRVLNEAALTSKLSDKFSLKVSNQLIFDNVPVEGFARYDQVTLVTLVASIL